jgi:flavin-binding protein dodecin
VTELASVADPVARLDAVRRAREALERLEVDTVAETRRAGITWSAIGALYGLTKQGAQQRFQTKRKDSVVPDKPG